METTFRINQTSRQFLARFLDELSLEQLNAIPQGFNNNIIWNIGHIVVTQQLLVYKLSGLPMHLPADLIAKYQKGTAPTAPVTQEEVSQIKDVLFSTGDQLKSDFNSGFFKDFSEYTTQTGNFTLHNAKEAFEFNNFHEALHIGVILNLKKLV